MELPLATIKEDSRLLPTNVTGNPHLACYVFCIFPRHVLKPHVSIRKGGDPPSKQMLQGPPKMYHRRGEVHFTYFTPFDFLYVFLKKLNVLIHVLPRVGSPPIAMLHVQTCPSLNARCMHVRDPSAEEEKQNFTYR